MATRVSLVRARLGTGDLAGALDLARSLAAENPDSNSLKAVLATTEAVNGNLETAATLYREMLEAEPNQATIWLALAQIRGRQSDPVTARAVVDEGLSFMPDNANLLWAKSSYLERDGEFDAAIDIYEQLYAQDSNSIVIANNLASMLSTYRTDEDSLNRAYVISRRFRDTQIPALQDTYGWIAHRRGASQEALPYLEAAAQGLPNDAVVQYHLGQVYLALGRQEDALMQFRKAVEVAAPADMRPQVADAKAQIKALQNPQN